MDSKSQRPCAVKWCVALAVADHAHCAVHVKDVDAKPAVGRTRFRKMFTIRKPRAKAA